MIKRIFLAAAASLLFSGVVGAQNPMSTVNYDESLVAPYSLEDPLRFVDGRKVRNPSDWEERRAEILDIFQHEMFGVLPPASEIYLEELESGPTLAGFGTRRQVRMWFREDHTGPKVDWMIVTPNFVKGPAPAVLLLNYKGNQTILDDPEVIISDGWSRSSDDGTVVDGRFTEKTRGLYVGDNYRTTFPVATILSRGYALVTACYCEVSPDPDTGMLGPGGELLQDTFAFTGVFDLWGPRDPSRTDNTTSVMAWAWALMRGMDMIEKDPALDESRVVLTGSSRLGKAAMLAGAYDDRFPVVVLNQTGGGGVPLAKRNFGENVATETYMFRHWYCRAYDRYAGHTDEMSFDQHLLVSAIAPRALLVEGFGSPWFDTKGEFLSLQAAEPVWKKLGRGGLGSENWPSEYDLSAVGQHLGYVRRDQDHGISVIDWKWMLDFADSNFASKVKKNRK